VAREFLCSSPKISRVETGTRLPTLSDVGDLCVLYRVDDAEKTHLIIIAGEAKQQGWWNTFDGPGIDLPIGPE
jgi:Helix-turn-helix domain